MRVMIVDDEEHARSRLKRLLESLSVEAVVFDRSIYALDYAKQNKVDVAFLDIAMPEMNGVELAKALKSVNKSINVIFCTGYSEYMQDAIDLHASGYLLKPASKEDVEKAMANLLHPIEKEMPKFYARTFGNFDFFVKGVPINFGRSKSKEMLAYLISLRGATATKKELAAVLFEDRYDLQTQNYLSKIFSNLVATLKEFGAENIVRKSRNSYSVDVSLFSCDLYDYDKGDPDAINAYKGEFMAQYGWGDL